METDRRRATPANAAFNSPRATFDENLASDKHPQYVIPTLFGFNALLSAANGAHEKASSPCELFGLVSRQNRTP